MESEFRKGCVFFSSEAAGMESNCWVVCGAVESSGFHNANPKPETPSGC